jgi:hypothetical protein
MENISELAAFLPLLENPGFKAGDIVVDDSAGAKISQWPYAAYDPIVKTFIDAAYQNNWVAQNFDWPKWAQSQRARRLHDDENALERATADELSHLLTVLIRQERFSEGSLLEAFKSGLVLRIVRRAKVLAGSEPISEPR